MKRILALLCATAMLTFGAATFAADAPTPKADAKAASVAPPTARGQIASGSASLHRSREARNTIVIPPTPASAISPGNPPPARRSDHPMHRARTLCCGTSNSP